jgi:phosphatidylserine decarboxylase
MANSTIEYFNRYTGKVEREDIYGEGFLRWTYGNPLGKLSLEGCGQSAPFFPSGTAAA